MGKTKVISSNLDLAHFTIDNDGCLCLKIKIGSHCEIKKISDYTVPSFVKDVSNAVHGVKLDRKLAEWLLDKEPTIFNGKEIELVEENDIYDEPVDFSNISINAKVDFQVGNRLLDLTELLFNKLSYADKVVIKKSFAEWLLDWKSNIFNRKGLIIEEGRFRCLLKDDGND